MSCCSDDWLRPESTPERLNIKLDAEGGCGPGKGVDPEYVDKIPGEVAEKGVEECYGCLCRSARQNRLHGNLKDWQDNFNKSVLESHGMFCKTTTKVRSVYNGTSSSTVEASSLSIAMTEEEIQKLESEDHVTGDTCCNDGRVV